MSKPKKTHTIEEVDKLTLQSERNGFIVGMVEAHRIFTVTMTDIKVSIENMQEIYAVSNHLGNQNSKVEELQLVWDALTHFDNMFQDKYDTSLENAKDLEYYDEIAAELDVF